MPVLYGEVEDITVVPAPPVLPCASIVSIRERQSPQCFGGICTFATGGILRRRPAMTLTPERQEALVAALDAEAGGYDACCSLCRGRTAQARFAAAALRAQGADQCWHQASWEAGGYGGVYHAAEYADGCADPCLLCQVE